MTIERQGYCLRHTDLPPARSEKLRRIVAPGCKIAYDVITHIGLARFVECHPCEEIRLQLSRHYGIDVPVRPISELTQKSVAYSQIVRRDSIQLLRKAMHDRGGHILHIDGTCEERSNVLLVCLGSLSGQVLESQKITLGKPR